ncbi:gamma DNA-directed DNA polymerase [Neolentinus lepideus HHB14362 ss-1]|uniref:Mitochondrial DNA polymerase catalytic subunit n=1 Tax=Neolentinus lepideus HHB14362 ss-1 TaxID=1314782 RepID=A0A165MRH3_9AGAM|nr:gamma DNA-directed DNA polymerase [Neolentinus lepideus HHB14362 ss-1]
MLNRVNPNNCSCRLFHSSTLRLTLQQKPVPVHAQPPRIPHTRQKNEIRREQSPAQKEEAPFKHAPRNELGVQLLSRPLHSQIFKNVSFPSPKSTYVRIAREHLEMHGLDPKQGSVLPDTGFTLPPLQGNNLDQHFHAIGAQASRPWLDIAKELAGIEDLPPKPDVWDIQPGWTKYCYNSDGSSYCMHVEYPEHDGQPEEMLVFDVETMPAYSPYPVLACAISKNGWYSWISPWLLGVSTDSKNLIPLGDPTVPRVIVGHNVSYDRGRILEEYSLEGTNNRFLDTMSLHVAVKGISSHQRPAWMKYRKSKAEARRLRDEAYEAVAGLIEDGSLSDMVLDNDESADAEADISGKRWEDLTSANSLADVAKLHCDIDMDKEVRNDFMTRTPAEILDGIHDYLAYCANDVAVTHSVFAKVLPEFLSRCPHPVSFAGMMTMGSSFLTVNEEWERYIENAERAYKELDDKVKRRLVDLAQQAKSMAESETWKGDVWLSQLDWTPKVAGKSRGVFPPEPEVIEATEEASDVQSKNKLVHSALPTSVPAWYRQILKDGALSATVINSILPLLLKASFDGHPIRRDKELGWHYVVDGERVRLPTASKQKVLAVLSKEHGVRGLSEEGGIRTCNNRLALSIAQGERTAKAEAAVRRLAEQTLRDRDIRSDPWLSQLDWKNVPKPADGSDDPKPKSVKVKKPKAVKPPPVMWPQWYRDLTKPKKDMPPGTIDLSVRNRLAPILLRLSWLGWPLFHSREHGWTFRVPRAADFQTRASELAFYDAADDALKAMSDEGGFVFYKLPHKDGEAANVGSPLAKTFMKYAQDGTLTSPGDEARGALDMNAQCSYWISARDRVMNQMVVWQDGQLKMGMKVADDAPGEVSERPRKWGMILPQVVTMGTVTRRAIEKTWLTASNAKKNRVGSELKAMVRAPEGYSIVGADVDSEELWISSVMGDAQFGLHGATAIGWMTLEGTKALGTDLHSKTASILGISRDQAKVFNYSRIYGAGMKHAVLLLMQANAGMLPEEAQKLAEQLYAQTKGKNTHRQDLFGRKFWYGGTESYVFNKLEEIALSDRPQTPALGCGITHALSKEYLPPGFGTDYMTSRINWVVQSSGVDYLHLLIVSMEHLIAKYKINARYLISVHDELRYLVADEDRYRAALALQVANLWTRCLFAYRLGMDDLPQGVAFFSSVDVDKILRKEVDMACVTPSQPVPLPPGESLNIQKVIERTNNGSLWKDGRAMTPEAGAALSVVEFVGYREPDCLAHRASSAGWLRAQATSEFSEIKLLARAEKRATEGDKDEGARRRKNASLSDAGILDWSGVVEEEARVGARGTA